MDTADLEIQKLDKETRAATTREMRRKILADKKDVLEPPPAVPTVTVDLHPDMNPAWQETERVGINYAPMGARRALAHAIEAGHSVGGNALDEMIRQYRISGMPPEEIAQRLQLTVGQVDDILTRLRQRAEARTPTEIRWLQTERIESIINSLWNMVTNGAVEQIELALKAIERLNKMYELESEKVKIELDYVTEGQAEVIFRACQMAVAAVVEVYEKKLAQAGVPTMDPEIIEGTLADAMDEAADLIMAAQSQPLVLERKGKEMVLINPDKDAKV